MPARAIRALLEKKKAIAIKFIASWFLSVKVQTVSPRFRNKKMSRPSLSFHFFAGIGIRFLQQHLAHTQWYPLRKGKESQSPCYSAVRKKKKEIQILHAAASSFSPLSCLTVFPLPFFALKKKRRPSSTILSLWAQVSPNMKTKKIVSLK